MISVSFLVSKQCDKDDLCGFNDICSSELPWGYRKSPVAAPRVPSSRPLGAIAFTLSCHHYQSASCNPDKGFGFLVWKPTKECLWVLWWWNRLTDCLFHRCSLQAFSSWGHAVVYSKILLDRETGISQVSTLMGVLFRARQKTNKKIKKTLHYDELEVGFEPRFLILVSL